MLALILMYVGFKYFDVQNIGGLFSSEMALEPWGWPKIWDLIKHLPLPAVIIGLAGMAEVMRIMRANLLDELRKPYVVTARAKGLSEQFDHEISWLPLTCQHDWLYFSISGLCSIIVSLVLSLPTVGPLL